MTSTRMGRRYIEEAGSRVELVGIALQRKLWATVVREAQECVELFLKGALRLVAVEPTRTHDVGEVLRRAFRTGFVRRSIIWRPSRPRWRATAGLRSTVTSVRISDRRICSTGTMPNGRFATWSTLRISAPACSPPPPTEAGDASVRISDRRICSTGTMPNGRFATWSTLRISAPACSPPPPTEAGDARKRSLSEVPGDGETRGSLPA